MSTPETFTPAWLADPNIHTVRELPPFSDHEIFASAAEA